MTRNDGRRRAHTRLLLVALTVVGFASGLLIAILGLPYGRLDYTAFADQYHNGTNTAGKVSFVIDCDIWVPGTQDGAVTGADNCTYDPQALPQYAYVNLLIDNETSSPIRLSAFNFQIVNPDATKINHVVTACDASGTDCNPDFNGDPTNDPTDTLPAPDVTGSWSCNPPPQDLGMPGVNNLSQMICFDTANPSDGPVIASGQSLLVARLKYAFVTPHNNDRVTLSFRNAAAADDTNSAIGSCNPVITDPQAFCSSASINFLGTDSGPTATWTPRPIATSTPTATPVPVSVGGVAEQPDARTLPSPTTSSGSDGRVYAIAAVATLIFVAFAATLWRRRARRD